MPFQRPPGGPCDRAQLGREHPSTRRYAHGVSSTAPGWYVDPEDASRWRWWDGAAWTENRAERYATAPPAAQPYAAQPYSSQTYASTLGRAPEGTDPFTTWIWLIVFVPVLPLLGLLAVDWGGIIDPNDRTGLSALRWIVSPGYLLAVVGGWVVYALSVFFSYRDWQELTDRQVPRPFHWAWAFLSSAVYAIGRSVVARRRTGRGISPMWWQLGMLALMLGLIIYITVAMVMGIVASVATLTA